MKSRTTPSAALGLLIFLSLCLPPAVAQDTKADDEIERLIKFGRVDALERKLGRAPDDLFKIARAARARAGRPRQKRAARDKAYTAADERYQAVLRALETPTDEEPAKRDMDKVRVYVDYAGMILSGWCGGDLDRFEISGGKVGDRTALAAKLNKSRRLYDKALGLVEPLDEDRENLLEEFLALGIYEDVKNYKPDCDFNYAFANLYYAMVAGSEAEDYAAALRTAEEKLQRLIDDGRAGQQIYQCHLGLAMSLREQGKFNRAHRHFRLASEEGADRVVIMQTRYEHARSLIKAGMYEEAREMLAPLLAKDPRNLPAEERGGKFYVHLGRLWDAKSYFAEASTIARAARKGGPGSAAMKIKARRTRETGLGRMNRLVAEGGPWPAVVKLHIADSIREGADPATLSPTELKFAAQKLLDEKKYDQALEFLTEAAGRKDMSAGLAAGILFELGKCHYSMDNLREAATAFDRVANEHKTHANAPQAVEFAYKLWGQLAKETKDKQLYANLAATLKNLVQSYPKHKSRAEALWHLPTALQAAGDYEEASRQLGNVSKSHPKWEEAQHRRTLLARPIILARRDALPPGEYKTEAGKAARTIRRYADDTYARAAKATTNKQQLLAWTADALVNSAELLVSAGVGKHDEAIEALTDFEKRFAESDLIGRVLACRIRAQLGQGAFEKASQLLHSYLETVTPQEAASVLNGMARSMQGEIDEMRNAGRMDESRKMAGDAVYIFEQLVAAIEGDPQRASQAEIASYGLARMRYFAGKYDEAMQIVAELIKKHPKNGNYQRLNANVLTDRLTDDAPADQLQAARKAWEPLLSPALRKKSPKLFWEARYNWLALMFREGEAKKVENAIRQDKVWYPSLGGAPWKEKLEALHQEVADKLGISLAEMPAADEPGQPKPSQSTP